MANILIIRYQKFSDGVGIVGAGDYHRKVEFFEYIQSINLLYKTNNTFNQEYDYLWSAAVSLGHLFTHTKIPIFSSLAELNYKTIKGNRRTKELTTDQKAEELEMRLVNESQRLNQAKLIEGLLIIDLKKELIPAVNPQLYGKDGIIFNEDRFLDASFEEVKRMLS